MLRSAPPPSEPLNGRSFPSCLGVRGEDPLLEGLPKAGSLETTGGDRIEHSEASLFH